MEFLVLWITSIVVSFILEMKNEFRMFKDVADAGYKIDTKRLSELANELNPEATKATFISMLIPILNIVQVFQRTVQYNNVKPYVLTQLSVMDALEEMNKEEIEEYSKKPTALNALLIPTKTKILLKTAPSVKIKNNNEEYEIFYRIDEKTKELTILKVTGTANKFTIEEQKQKVLNAWKEILAVGEEQYGSIDNIKKELANNPNMNLSKNKEAEVEYSKKEVAQFNPYEEMLKNPRKRENRPTEEGPKLSKKLK